MTPAALPRLALAEKPVWPAGAFKASASASRLVEAVPALQGARSPLRPPGGSGDASHLLCAVSSLMPPPWTPDAIRVGGYPLPGRDLQPARDAKLILARERSALALALEKARYDAQRARRPYDL